MKTEIPDRQILVGDVHGEWQGLKKILLHAEIIDGKGDWIGGTTVLIQTGDVIDRGPHSWECVRLLRKLQEQAAAAGGRVVRLCGNHEIMLMQCPFNRYADFPNAAWLASEMESEICLGRLQASHTDGSRLYTHAGLRSEVRTVLMTEIGLKTCSLGQLSDHINEVFRNAVRGGDLETHPIFHIDWVRGGSHEVGGLFWGDYSLIRASDNAYDIPQIFGHTPTRKKGVVHSHNFRLIDIDAGMHVGYGGNILYLEIDRSGTILQHHEEGRAWVKTTLGQDSNPSLQS